MFEGSAHLYVDLGNSQTRVMVKFRKFTSEVHTFSNQFAVVADSYEIPDSYLESDSVVFEVPTSEGPRKFAHGSLALREFSSYLIKPTALEPKFKSFTTTLTVNRALLKGYEIIGQYLHMDPDSLKIDWDITVLCPPVHMARRDLFEKLVRSVDKVNVTYPEAHTYEISMNKVTVVPEGIAAFFAIAFDEKKQIRESLRDLNLKESSVLVMDVGAGTTDVCVIDGFRAIDNTKDTFAIGGNNVYQQVNKILKADGYNFREDRVMEGTITGFVKDGSKDMDITSEVKQVKSLIAEALRNNLRRSFESSMFDPRGIEYLVVVGGGALEGRTTSLGQTLLNSMKQLSPNISLIEIPSNLDMRHLNIIGSSVIS